MSVRFPCLKRDVFGGVILLKRVLKRGVDFVLKSYFIFEHQFEFKTGIERFSSMRVLRFCIAPCIFERNHFVASTQNSHI